MIASEVFLDRVSVRLVARSSLGPPATAHALRGIRDAQHAHHLPLPRRLPVALLPHTPARPAAHPPHPRLLRSTPRRLPHTPRHRAIPLRAWPTRPRRKRHTPTTTRTNSRSLPPSCPVSSLTVCAPHSRTTHTSPSPPTPAGASSYTLRTRLRVGTQELCVFRYDLLRALAANAINATHTHDPPAAVRFHNTHPPDGQNRPAPSTPRATRTPPPPTNPRARALPTPPPPPTPRTHSHSLPQSSFSHSQDPSSSSSTATATFSTQDPSTRASSPCTDLPLAKPSLVRFDWLFLQQTNHSSS